MCFFQKELYFIKFLSPHLVLINERLTQRENGFFTKESTIATLQH